jgi:hypothetical protein
MAGTAERPPVRGWPASPPTPEAVRARYGITAPRSVVVAGRARGPLVADGRLDEPTWAEAAWSARFGDLVTGAPGLYDTRVAAAWDDDALWVGFRAEEPWLRASLTRRDDLVWYDDGDLELFVAGPDAYWELEVNALGTVYEVLHVWADACRPGGSFDRPDLDPRARPDARGFTGNGDPDRWDWDGLHPRGNRWSFLDWDLPGLATAVHLDGTLNDDRDVDRGWSLELRLPWAGLAEVLGGPVTPRPGLRVACAFARFRNLELNGRPVRPTTGWTLDPHGRYDIHVPEAFSIVELAE